jgi:3-deoxy-D-manno-octulosonic acid kinase
MKDASGHNPASPGIVPAQVEIENGYILYDSARIPPPGREFFEPAHWQASGVVAGAAPGRGSVCIVSYRGEELALRHYLRGGWAASLSRDRYLWTGLDKTRAWQEWRLLAALHGQGLPVPRPVAARVLRHGPLYSADLVTAYLPGARPLAERLIDEELPEAVWRGIGGTIRRFHGHGVFHADLNARNILLDEGGAVYLVDFDKGRRDGVDPGRRLDNLARLQRSLGKFRRDEPGFHFDNTVWGWLLSGYREGR